MKTCFAFYFLNFLFTFATFEESKNHLEMCCSLKRLSCFLTIFPDQIHVIINSSTFIYELDNWDKGDQEKSLQSELLKWMQLLETRRKQLARLYISQCILSAIQFRYFYFFIFKFYLKDKENMDVKEIHIIKMNSRNYSTFLQDTVKTNLQPL